MVTKTITYGIMHMTVAIAVAYALSGSWIIALSIGTIEPIVQTLFYNLHERVWKKLEKSKSIKSGDLQKEYVPTPHAC